MAGEALPALHVQNVQQAWYVDASGGNDSTGDGSFGNPWQTVQKAADYLKNTATWPSSGDVAVYLKAGRYKAASSQSYTLDLSFTAGARSPNSTRWLIFKAAPGAAGAVFVSNPSGLTGSKGAIRVAASTGCNYICFDGLDVDGEQQVKGAAGNGNSVGVYLVGLPLAHIEFVRGAIHGFRGASGAGNTQGMQSGSTSDVLVYFNHIYDIDAVGSGTNVNESHGVYLPGERVHVVGNLIEIIPNGYNVHYYGTAIAGNGSIVASNTLVNAKASGEVLPGNAVGATIKNNLFVDHTGRGVDSFGIQFFPASSGSGSGDVIDRNLFFNNSGGARSETSPTGWTITNSLSTNPLFVGGGNYHLQAASPAINAGDSAYQPAVDLDGAARVTPDLGAYAAPTGGGSFVGSFALPLTFAATAAAGIVGHFGSLALPLTFGLTVTGTGGFNGSVALPLTLGVTVAAGIVEHKGAVALPLTLTIAVSSTVEHTGSFALPLTLTIAAAGIVSHFGAFTLPLTFGFAAAGRGGFALVPVGVGTLVATPHGNYELILVPATDDTLTV